MRPVIPNFDELGVARRRIRRLVIFVLVLAPIGACSAYAYSPSQRPGLANIIAGSR